MFTKKTFIAFILAISILVATPITVLSSMGDDLQQFDQSEDVIMDSSGSNDLEIMDDTEDSSDDTGNTDETDETGDGTSEPTDNANGPDDGADDLIGNSDGPTGGTDEPDDGTGEPNGGTDELENTDEQDNDTDEPINENDDIDVPSENDLLFLNITIDEERNVTACGTEEIEYAVPSENDCTLIDEIAFTIYDEYGEGSFDILLQSHNPEIDIYDVELNIELPLDWVYEMWFSDDSNFDDDTELGDSAEPEDDTEFNDDYVIITITPPQQMMLAMPREDDPIRVETRAELINVFNYGAATGGDFNWSGTRIVEIAFNNIGDVITPNIPAAERTIILRSADGIQRDIAVNNGNRHFVVRNRITLVIDDENLHFVGRDLANVDGGGINVEDGGTLKLYNGTIKNCRAGFGGGVNVSGANALFEMHGGFIEQNKANDSGGGVLTTNWSTFYMYDGTIRGNSVRAGGNSGGGVRVMGSSVFNMQDGVIENNEVVHTGAFAYGGGVIVGEVSTETQISTFNMNGGIIKNNNAQWGGGVAAFNGFFNLGTGRTERGAAPDSQTGSVFNPLITGNEALGQGAGWAGDLVGYGGGGGVWAYDYMGRTYSFVMHSGTITGNETRFRGGGVFINKTDCVILGGEISNNHTTDNANVNTGGGGVYLYTNNTSHIPTLTVKNATISGNSSRIGGGIARGFYLNTSNSDLIPISILDNAVISGNTAQLDGGGIHTGTPGNGSKITSASVGTGRSNLKILETAKFEGNRSQVPISYGLTVDQAKINGDLFAKIGWSGKNSARGSLDKANSYHLFNNHDINNLQGAIVRDFATLTVSNTIGGDLGNMLKEFEYTITFTDSDGKPLPSGTQFAYIGDTVPGTNATAPTGGTLTLDNSGSAPFTLGHGQAITLQEIRIGDHVQVIEASDDYDASFADSDNENNVSIGNDTGLLEMTGNRLLSFNNERSLVSPPTGVSSDDTGKIMLFVAAVFLIGSITLTINAICRERNQVKNSNRILCSTPLNPKS